MSTGVSSKDPIGTLVSRSIIQTSGFEFSDSRKELRMLV